MVTCGTGDVAITRQNGIKKQQLTDLGLILVKGDKIGPLQWLWKRVPIRGCARERAKNDDKGRHMKRIVIAALLTTVSPVFAEIETGRDLMDAKRYSEAMTELLPAARSGNAEAEELIGVMYALGLGVARDDVRAFEWYLRASLKGHAGAQSGIGWYYEVGRGMPAPDLIRAYMWYTLSAIGGDPDAAISLEEVVKKMTQAQIDKAHILVDDYRTWLYPFR